MKNLKPFVAGCYSEVIIAEGTEDTPGAAADAAKDADVKESTDDDAQAAKDSAKEKETGEQGEGAESDDVPPAPPYHSGLGSRFKFPGDPRK